MDVKITFFVYFASIIVVWTKDFDIHRIYDRHSSNVVKDIGCGKISSGAVLIKDDVMTTMFWCTRECWLKDYMYSFISGSRCLCGNTAPDRNKVPESKCHYHCRSCPTQKCGGKKVATRMKTGYISIDYKVLGDLAVKVMFTNMGEKKTEAMKKFTDGKCIGWRPRKRVSFSGGKIEKNICVVHCHYNKFIFALLTDGNKCICTSRDPSRGARILDQAVCNKTCSGSSKDRCGGVLPNVHNVFLAGVFKEDAAKLKGYYIPPNLKQDWSNFSTVLSAVRKSFLERYFNISTVSPTVMVFPLVKEKSYKTPIVVGVTLSSLFVIVTIIVMVCLYKKNKGTVLAVPEEEKMNEQTSPNLDEEKKSKRRKKKRSKRRSRERHKRNPQELP